MKIYSTLLFIGGMQIKTYNELSPQQWEDIGALEI